MSHKRGPLVWTIAIYALSTICSMKMAKELPKQQHFSTLSLCLFLHFTHFYLKPTTTTTTTLLLSSFSLHSVFLLLFLQPCSLSFFSLPPLWTVLTSSTCPRMSGKDAMNGLFYLLFLWFSSELVSEMELSMIYSS